MRISSVSHGYVPAPVLVGTIVGSYSLPKSKHIVIFDTLIKESQPNEVEAVLAHELGHWYYMHPLKLMSVSQLHIFAILALFPAFLHSPPVLRSFDFPPSVAATPPTIIAFLLFQVRKNISHRRLSSSLTNHDILSAVNHHAYRGRCRRRRYELSFA